jgi:hypothetical protein
VESRRLAAGAGADREGWVAGVVHLAPTARVVIQTEAPGPHSIPHSPHWDWSHPQKNEAIPEIAPHNVQPWQLSIVPTHAHPDMAHDAVIASICQLTRSRESLRDTKMRNKPRISVSSLWQMAQKKAVLYMIDLWLEQ